MFATVSSMAHRSENGSEKMAEGDNSAELLKEKANQYFKGKFIRLVKSAVLVRFWEHTQTLSMVVVATKFYCNILPFKPTVNAKIC